MYKDVDNNECRISYTNSELAEIINTSKSSVSRHNLSLEKKGYLEDSKSPIKKFNLRELDKLFIWKLGEHENRLDDLEIRLAKMEEESKRYKEENKFLRKQLKENNIKEVYLMD